MTALPNQPMLTSQPSLSEKSSEPHDRTTTTILDLDAVVFAVLLKGGKTVKIGKANSYQPEGPLTTFFSSGSSRQTIDSWSVRVASYRTADIVSIERSTQAAFVNQPHEQPILTAV